jgi:hypothetical protein
MDEKSFLPGKYSSKQGIKATASKVAPFPSY